MPVSISFRRSLKEGFTLVELLVVIAIIGILSTLLLLQLATARGKARDVKRIADVTQIRSALEQYYDDNSGTYAQSSLYAATPPLAAYIAAMPKDPLDQAEYGYATKPLATGKTLGFQVWAELEIGNPALKSDSDITTTGWTIRNTGSTRTNVLTNGGDPASGICTSADLNTVDCVYDLGVP